MQMEGFRDLSGELQEKELCSFVEFFKMPGNPTRIHILTAWNWHINKYIILWFRFNNSTLVLQKSVLI